ncbi:MAG: CHAT domain-containing protein [Pirellulaceae bacterium]
MSQPTLRISQSTIGPGQYRAELSFEGDGQPRFTARADFEFQLTPQRREDVRWYLEDYLQYPHDPAPKIAARVEADMQAIGVELFAKVMQANDDTRDLWAQLRRRLDDTRIEIETSVAEATSIPWELIHDPKTDVSLALRATALVRSHSQAAQRPELPRAETGPIRILLAICRPGGDSDVPFRSVASQLIKGLGDQATDSFELDVLRPATYEQLARTLQQAKAAGSPYHVVHFDGHGMYAEVAEPTGDDAEAAAVWLQLQGPLMLSGPRAGRHGYLMFERPDHETNMQLVDGPTLGNLLVTNDVSVLVLNACRSAHAEAPSEPETVASDNIHEQVRAIGSLAQEVMDAGVAGVVAMRYNVYVVTAAQFVADLYGELIAGRTLGEAVSFGRKQLHAQPMREISYAPRSLQDWCVPVVYEAAPIRLFEARSSESPQFTIQAGSAMHGRGAVDRDLPRPPGVGFYGRDETVLALDRAFDNHRIVLLHAFAGSGKTSTAAEFARWYAMTGGVAEPPLFTTFETKRPLPRVLDAIGQRFGARLEQAGIHWLTLDDDQRRDVALQVLGQVPVLWLWDNVEPIMGLLTAYPATGSLTTGELDSAAGYTPDERQALADFLRDAAATKAKILLTSRRDEQKWLGELPCRITVPPMPMLERVQLTRKLAERRQRRLTDVDDWRHGGDSHKATRSRSPCWWAKPCETTSKTKQRSKPSVDQRRAGEAAFDDEISEGRTRSLGASLSYGSEHAFTEEERRILSLLHLFQGFVDGLRVAIYGRPGNKLVHGCRAGSHANVESSCWIELPMWDC